MLLVKTLTSSATVPTVAHPGEDLAFDLYSAEPITIMPYQAVKVHTGIAAQFVKRFLFFRKKYGLLIRDRSGVASKALFITGGVIDSSYTGEILVLMTNLSLEAHTFSVGDRIAQMIPIPIKTDCAIKLVENFPLNSRGTKGFGSSGR